MIKTRTIPIMNQVDIHAARMYTREAARLVGLELNEQAQVSMATSALAECLKMGVPNRSAAGPAKAANQIVIQVIELDPTGSDPASSDPVKSEPASQEQPAPLPAWYEQKTQPRARTGSLQTHNPQGLQVDFESANVVDCESIQVQLKRIQSMVDVIQTENLPSGTLRVRMIKWGRHAVANHAVTNSGPKE